VRHVSQALTAKLGDFITFPSTRAEREEIKQGLFQVCGFPCAIGCTDGTHIRITARHENEPDFVNPKGHHSIDVQVIYIQSVTKLFGQNTYLDFIPPLPPNTMLITAIIIFSSSTVTSTVNVISPKATLLRGEGRGAVQN